MKLLDDLDEKCNDNSTNTCKTASSDTCSTCDVDLSLANSSGDSKTYPSSEACSITGLPTYRPRRLSDDRISEIEQSQLPHADRVIRPPISRNASDGSIITEVSVTFVDNPVTPQNMPKFGLKTPIALAFAEESSVPSSESGSSLQLSTAKQSDFGKYKYSSRLNIPNQIEYYDLEYYSDVFYDDDEDKENQAPNTFYYGQLS